MSATLNIPPSPMIMQMKNLYNSEIDHDIKEFKQPAPAWVMGMQIMRRRKKEAMLNLKISQFQQKQIKQQADSATEAGMMQNMIMDYSSVPAHLRHLPPRMVKQRLLRQPRHQWKQQQHQHRHSKNDSNQQHQQHHMRNSVMAMIEELRCRDAAAAPPASLVQAQQQLRYQTADHHELRQAEYDAEMDMGRMTIKLKGEELETYEVIAILPGTLDEDDSTLVAILRPPRPHIPSSAYCHS